MPFTYRGDRLFATRKADANARNEEGGRDLLELARGTEGPFYVYALSDVLARARRLRASFGGQSASLHYAMKANGNPVLLRALAREGLGVDTVSGGEIEEALAAGFAPGAIIFSGAGKTVREVDFAVRSGIKQINVESPQELERIAHAARRSNRVADVAFRMNPDVSPRTHPYITTGFRENKFGMDESFIPELRRVLAAHRDSLRLRGLTLHIGSQLTELDSLEEAITKTLPVFRAFRAEGHALDRFDIGGGLGIDYSSDETAGEFALIEEYGRLANRLLGPEDCETLCEPGRILVARAGLLVGQVQYVKTTPHKTFAILDTGMHHLLRPALYGARHRVFPLEKRPDAEPRAYDVVGPICESSDFLAKDVPLPRVEPGDYLAIADAGAYGYSMASRYNRHALPIEVVLD